MIKNRCVYTNPYRDFSRMNGVRADRFSWAERERAHDFIFAVAFAAVLGFASGVIVMLLATGT